MKSIRSMLMGGAADAPMDFAAVPVSREAELAARIDWIWANRTAGPDGDHSAYDRFRYIARSLTGGSGWMVFDRVLNRHLTNDELLALPLDQLKHATHLN